MDVGPISLVYYSLCAAPGAVAGLFVGLVFTARPSVGAMLITTIVGAIGGMVGGYRIATLQAPPWGTSNEMVVVLLFTAMCGALFALVAAHLLQRSGG